MNRFSIYAFAFLKLEAFVFTKWKSLSEPKESLKDYSLRFVRNLLTLANISDTPSDNIRSYWYNSFNKIEPSELDLLTNFRSSKPFIDFYLDEERLIYKFFIKCLYLQK